MDRAGQRVDPIEVTPAQVLSRRRLGNLAVEGITRRDLDLFAGRRFDDRRDCFVPAVVALARLLGEAFGVVDHDALHSPSQTTPSVEAMHKLPLLASAGGSPGTYERGSLFVSEGPVIGEPTSLPPITIAS